MSKTTGSKVIGSLAIQEWMIDPETVKVMEALEATGVEARFVGGCVRNALVNKPVADIDIATPLLPEDVMDHLDKAKISFVPTGLLHGTITAISGGKAFEITTLRRDMRPRGRHADVVFTDDWKLDAARRDFTINAMSADAHGTLYDYFDGIRHLREGRVVFVGDPETRIKEDILRLLRYFRFLAQFSLGAPEENALAACRKLAHLLPRLSSERIRQEVFKLLETPRAAEIWALMLDQGVTAHILPEAINLKRLAFFIKAETLVHAPPLPLWRLAALLEVTRNGLKDVAEFLKLSTRDVDSLNALLFSPIAVHTNDPAAQLRRAAYRLGHDITLGLLMLDSAGQRNLVNLEQAHRAVAAFRPPVFPLTGQDVLATGVKPGPEVGEILRQVETWWIDADFAPGRSACLAQIDAVKSTMK
jgi:poly(A) polymerase